MLVMMSHGWNEKETRQDKAREKARAMAGSSPPKIFRDLRANQLSTLQDILAASPLENLDFIFSFLRVIVTTT